MIAKVISPRSGERRWACLEVYTSRTERDAYQQRSGIMARRRSSSITNLLQDITDDIKDFIDDEVVDRGRDTERDLRRAGRNWTDSDDDDDDRGRRSRRRGSSRRDDDMDELREAITALSKKVSELSEKK
jgi:hypothetical protein